MTAAPTSRFPWWIILGATILAAVFLPTLVAPFDFIDDGNLVYPNPQPHLSGYVHQWWGKVQANVEHLGPFRPTLWVHWELAANTFGGDPLPWRMARLVFCWLSAASLLWLFREFNIPAPAALLAGAVAMWNPYRSEIWTSLTLAEGIAMPYALFSLVAARKASTSPSPWKWELAAMLGIFMALGCKNTFAALIPVQIVLRCWPDGLAIRTAVRQHGLRSLLLLLPLALPIAHFIYFQLNWRPGNYQPHSPTFAQGVRILNSYKGALGLDFVGMGLAAIILVAPRIIYAHAWAQHRVAMIAGGLLALGGMAVYLPLDMIAPRYSMPGVWGLDILVAITLAGFGTVPTSHWKTAALVTFFIGLGIIAGVTIGREEKVRARANLLWNIVETFESSAPPGATVAWVSGDSTRGALNEEEGIHFAWHLRYRARVPVKVGLVKDSGEAITRVELPPLVEEPMYRVAGVKAESNWWQPEKEFAQKYWWGRKQFQASVSRSKPLTPKQVLVLPPAFLEEAFAKDSGGKVKK